MKKVLLFMLTTVMAFSLAACESSGDSPSLPSQNSEPASGFAEESQAASESPERAESSEDTKAKPARISSKLCRKRLTPITTTRCWISPAKNKTAMPALP